MQSIAAEETSWQKGAPRWWLITVIVALSTAVLWLGGSWVKNVEAQVDKVPGLIQEQAETRKALKRLNGTVDRMERDQIRQALFEAKRHKAKDAIAYFEARLKELDPQ